MIDREKLWKDWQNAADSDCEEQWYGTLTAEEQEAVDEWRFSGYEDIEDGWDELT